MRAPIRVFPIRRALRGAAAGLCLCWASLALSTPETARPKIDHEAPAIFVVAPQPVAPDLPITLRVRVEDPSGVASVTAFVKGENEKTFRELPMTLDDAGAYVAPVPALPERGHSITYYVEARDERGNGPRRSGSPRRPYVARTLAEPGAAPAPRGQVARGPDRRWTLAAIPVVVAAACFLSIARRRRLEREFWREVLGPVLRLAPADRAQALEQLQAQPHLHPLRGHVRLDRAELLRRLQEVKLAPPAARTPRSAPGTARGQVVAPAGAAGDSSQARDAWGNRRGRTTAPVQAGARPGTPALARGHGDGIASTLRELEEEIFWIQLLEPICRMPDDRVGEAIRLLAARPLEHPHEGARLYPQKALFTRLERVRTTDTDEVRDRWNALERERAALGPEAPDSGSAGMSLIELLVVLAILAVALAIGAVYLEPLEAPVDRGADQLESTLRDARSRAVASTSAHRVRPETNGTLVTEYAASCAAATWTAEPGTELELPDGVTLTDTSWSVCFNTRGIAASGRILTLDHPDFNPREVEVMLGGAVRRVS